MIKTETIPIMPDKSLMPKIGKSGHSITEALAELIDNAIDARDIEERLFVNILLNRDGRNSFIKVKDNAEGMIKKEITNAFILAKSEKKGKLGEFGLGLKSACMSLGEIFSVESSKRNMPTYKAILDENEWMKNEKWELDFEYDENNISDFHGTIIEIHKLRFELRSENIKRIINELVNRFQYYISAQSLRLEIEDINYDSKGKKKIRKYTCMSKPVDFIKKEGFKFLTKQGFVEGEIGLLKKPTDKYGLNTFRQNRLIEPYSKIGLGSTVPESSANYIFGQVHMSHVPVTHNKREWIKTSIAYLEIEKKLKNIIKYWLIKAREYESYVIKDEKIKRLPLKEINKIFRNAARICENIDFDKSMKAFKIETDLFSDIDGFIKKTKKIESKEKEKTKITSTKKTKSPESKDINEKQEKGFVIKIKGKEYRFHIHQIPRGEKSPIKSWEKEEYSGTIITVINITHPIYRQINKTQSGIKLWVNLIAMEVMSEIIVESRTIAVRDRYLSELLSQK